MSALAPIAQRIERQPPELKMQVRFLLGALRPATAGRSVNTFYEE